MSARFVIADHNGSRLFACVTDAQFVKPEVSTSRLGASLHPYPDVDCAIAALKAAGGENVRLAG